MTEEALTARLVAEVEDLLSMSTVGLYEVRWILRGVAPHLGPGTVARTAAAAVVELKARGFEFGWFDWPSDEPRSLEGDPPIDDENSWAAPRRGQPYLALLPK